MVDGREAMRAAYDERIDALVVSADHAPPWNPLAITAIEVRTYFPDESQLWRYIPDEDDDRILDGWAFSLDGDTSQAREQARHDNVQHQVTRPLSNNQPSE